MAVSKKGTMRKLDMTQVATSFGHYRKLRKIGTLQTVLFVMVGGGFLGASFAESPADAYIDSRVGKLPYSRKEIEQMRQILIAHAKYLKLDPHKLPPRADFHCGGIL